MRRIDRDQPTLLVDESEELQKAGSDSREVFNSGYKPGGVVPRAQGAGEIVYNTYCPKVYGMIGDPDRPLRARSIMVLMEKGNVAIDDKPQVFQPVGAAIGVRLSSLVTKSVLDIEATYLGDDNTLKAILPVQRDREIWECLFAVCKHIAPNRLEELTAAAQAISTLKTRQAKRYTDLKEASEDATIYQYAGQLARDSHRIAKASGVRLLPTHALIEELVRIPTWKVYQDSKGVKIGDPDNNGHLLASMLQLAAGNDTCPKVLKVRGKSVRGYTLDWLAKAAQRAG
jgi:hypothetical protein